MSNQLIYTGKYVRTFTAEGKLASQAEEKNEELRSCVADLQGLPE